MCDVPSIAVFCSESIECFPGTASRFFLKLLVTIPVAPIIIGIILHFRFHIRCISIHKLLYFNFFSASICTTFLSAGIATSIRVHVFSFLFLIIISGLFAAIYYYYYYYYYLLRGFGPRRDEVTGEWRKLHNGELHDLYSSPNIVRVIKSRTMRLAGRVARMGERRGVYRVLVGKPEGKRPLGRPRRRWEVNIKMDLKEVRCRGMDWIELAQDRDRWRYL